MLEAGAGASPSYEMRRTVGSSHIGNDGALGQNNIGFWVGTIGAGQKQMHIDTNGIGIGMTTLGARLDVLAQGALSTDIAFRVRNSVDSSNHFTVKGNGVINALNLPTSSAGLVAGDIWNNSGVLNIV